MVLTFAPILIARAPPGGGDDTVLPIILCSPREPAIPLKFFNKKDISLETHTEIFHLPENLWFLVYSIFIFVFSIVEVTRTGDYEF